jgi:hypothetical protein
MARSLRCFSRAESEPHRPIDLDLKVIRIGISASSRKPKAGDRNAGCGVISRLLYPSPINWSLYLNGYDKE